MEMVLEDDASSGGLFDLNMLVETGGKLRSLKDWEELFVVSGLQLTSLQKLSPILTLLKGEFK